MFICSTFKDKIIVRWVTGLEGLDVPANICFGLQEVTLVHLEWVVDLLVGHDHVGTVGFHHQKRLAECARAFAQNLVGIKWNDVAQGDDEPMHVPKKNNLKKNTIVYLFYFMFGNYL